MPREPKAPDVIEDLEVRAALAVRCRYVGGGSQFHGHEAGESHGVVFYCLWSVGQVRLALDHDLLPFSCRARGLTCPVELRGLQLQELVWVLRVRRVCHDHVGSDGANCCLSLFMSSGLATEAIVLRTQKAAAGCHTHGLQERALHFCIKHELI